MEEYIIKAYVHQGNQLSLGSIEETAPEKNQVKVNMKTAGLNRRDLMIPARRGYNEQPLALGSDGAGVVEAIGEGVVDFKVGDAVIVNPGIGWLNNGDVAPEGFEVVGYPGHGTFAEKYLVDADYLERKPDFLTWEEAGVLALAGLTGYRALFSKGKVSKGDTVFVPGAGSGVATYLVQFAKAAGARVIVSSRSNEKRAAALLIGADRAIDTNADWKDALKNETIDLVIESVGEATFNRSLAVLKRGGKVVTFGATTADNVTINLRTFFYAQQQLLGSTLGSREELREMLAFIQQHQIHPVVDRVLPLEATDQAFEFLKDSHQFGKIAIRISE